MPVVFSSSMIIESPSSANPNLYRVLNNETIFYVINNTASTGVEGSSAARDDVAKSDVTFLQHKWPDARDEEMIYLAQIKAIRSAVELYCYMEATYYRDNAVSDSGDTHRATYLAATQNSAPALWLAVRADDSAMAHAFNETTSQGINFTQLTTNSLGKRFGRDFADRWYDILLNDAAGNRLQYYRGVIYDDFNCRPNLKQKSGAGSYDWDWNNSSVNADRLTDSTFLDAWLTGLYNLIADTRLTFGATKGVSCNPDFGYWYRQISADGCLPRPISATILNQLVDVGMMENMAWYGLGVGDDAQNNNHTYPIKSFFSISTFFLIASLYQFHVKPAASNVHGKAMVGFDQKLAVSIGTSPNSTDYAFARACWVLTKLIDGTAYGCAWQDGNRPFFLDEQCIELGAVSGSRSPGTLDQSAAPVTFSMRANDFSSGGVTALWQEFANAIVVWRNDTTGLTLGSSNFADGSASSITLPSAGTGFHWDRFDCTTYVHPSYSDLAMASQDTTTNSGAASVTSVSLKPLHGIALRRVAD